MRTMGAESARRIKIFVVLSKEPAYSSTSDVKIMKIFSDRKLAEDFCNIMQENMHFGLIREYFIEEYEV